jgi:hypothetical protein
MNPNLHIWESGGRIHAALWRGTLSRPTVVGTVSISNKFCGVWTVWRIAGPGWGASALYPIAFAMSPTRTLAPDRNSSDTTFWADGVDGRPWHPLPPSCGSHKGRPALNWAYEAIPSDYALLGSFKERGGPQVEAAAQEFWARSY